MTKDDELDNDDNDCGSCSDDDRDINDRPGWISARAGYDYDDNDGDNDKRSGLVTFRIGQRGDTRSGHTIVWIGDKDDDDNGINPINDGDHQMYEDNGDN